MSAGGWLTSLGTLYEPEPSLRYAVLAMSCSILGGRDGDSQLRFKGLQTYTLSIKELKKALRDEWRANSDAVLAAIRIMGSYEVLFSYSTGTFSVFIANMHKTRSSLAAILKHPWVQTLPTRLKDGLATLTEKGVCNFSVGPLPSHPT